MLAWLPYMVAFGGIISYEGFRGLATQNLVVQFVWFIVVACIPAHRTGNIGYVDIAWPWGLVWLGLQGLLWPGSQGLPLRRYLGCGALIVAGLRMGLGAVHLWSKGWLNKELPRYQYQRRRWERDGRTNLGWVRQEEILVQAWGNASFFAVPMLLLSYDARPTIHAVEWLGWGLWVAAIVFESIADLQKQAFALKCKKAKLSNQCCEDGLWAYSRHPNYFGEWMVWVSIIIAGLPSALSLIASGVPATTPLPPALRALAAAAAFPAGINLGSALLISGSLVFIAYVMYICLCYWTGAKPAEYYSVQKRPGYKDYQRRVNMFFPWFPKAKKE